MAKRPAFQFYPGDWLRDTALRSCSIGARGLWIDMLCLMHEGEPYGYLKVGDKVILPPNLARMVGATLKEVQSWILELEDANVFSKDEHGCVFSRRMVKDEKTRAARAAGGKLGGNPALRGSGKVETKDNLPPNQEPTPSSAVAVASSSSNLNPVVVVIADTWWPSEKICTDLQALCGFSQEWIDQQVPPFIEFWQKQNEEPRSTWNALFYDHCVDRSKLRSVS